MVWSAATLLRGGQMLRLLANGGSRGLAEPLKRRRDRRTPKKDATTLLRWSQILRLLAHGRSRGLAEPLKRRRDRRTPKKERPGLRDAPIGFSRACGLGAHWN